MNPSDCVTDVYSDCVGWPHTGYAMRVCHRPTGIVASHEWQADSGESELAVHERLLDEIEEKLDGRDH